MAIIVFQHGGRVTPGRLGMTLRDHGFTLDIRRLDLPPEKGGKGVPTDYDNVHAVLSLGGEQNVGDPHPWMQQEIDYLRGAHERELPVIGVCLGAQLIAHALGGRVGPMDRPEWGFHRVSINPVGQVETILSGIAWDSMQFQAHGQEVKELPQGATLLASSDACQVQAFRAGLRTFAFQYHFECDRTMIEAFVAESAESLAKAGVKPADVKTQADAHYPTFGRLADRLCVNLAAYAFPFERQMTA